MPRSWWTSRAGAGGRGLCMLPELVVFLLSVSCAVRGETAASLVESGNAAFAAESFEEALEFYEQASVEAPESAEIVFNKGNVHYRREDYSEAKDAFLEAARKSLDPRLEARCHYNLGNVAFRESERQRDSDLKKSLKACEKSILHYQDALECDPEIENAARNIEVVRLTIKMILDEIKKREEAQKQQEQAGKKIEELLKRQRQATSYGVELVKRGVRARSTVSWKRDVAGAADRQGKLRDDTATVAEELAQQSQSQHQQQAAGQAGQAQGPQMPGPIDQAKQHLDSAVGFQDQATGQLVGKQPGGAQPHQKEAEEQLEKALEALTKPQQGEQNKQQQQNGDEDKEKSEEGEENEEEEDGKQDQNQQDEEGQQKEEEQQKQQAQAVPDEKARDILDEERENRERRRPRQSRGYRPVNKDW